VELINRKKHVFHTRENCKAEDERDCTVCSGGLSACEVCGGAEGAMPTDCPGVPMNMQQLDDVYAGTMDYLCGEWRDPMALGKLVGVTIIAKPVFLITVPVTLPPLLVRLAQRHYDAVCRHAAKPGGTLHNWQSQCSYMVDTNGTIQVPVDFRQLDLIMKIMEGWSEGHWKLSDRYVLQQFQDWARAALQQSINISSQEHRVYISGRSKDHK
jgi:hypothetical protein